MGNVGPGKPKDDDKQVDERLSTLERRQEITLRMLSAMSRYIAGDEPSGKPVVRTTDKLAWYSVIYGLLALSFALCYAAISAGGWPSGLDHKTAEILLIIMAAISMVSTVMVIVWGGQGTWRREPLFGGRRLGLLRPP